MRGHRVWGVTRAPLILSLVLAAPLLVAASDDERGQFARCSGSERVTCVVDGDTIWFEGRKIRLADINTPEISRPACRREAELGERATRRLTALLNHGPFTLRREGKRDKDYFGRALRVVERDGHSLGTVLVDEGLAETWRGRRGNWCAA